MLQKLADHIANCWVRAAELNGALPKHPTPCGLTMSKWPRHGVFLPATISLSRAWNVSC